MYFTDIAPFYGKVVFLSGINIQSSLKHDRRTFTAKDLKSMQFHLVQNFAVFRSVTVFNRDKLKCQSFSLKL